MLLTQCSCRRRKIPIFIGMIFPLFIFYFYLYSDNLAGTIISESTDGKNRIDLKRTFDFIQETFPSNPIAAQYLKVLNVSYVQYLKNPCWFEKGNNFSVTGDKYKNISTESDFEVLRCLPSFFIAGFPKCGSSDIYLRTTKHPDIIPTDIKSLHWWSFKRFGKEEWLPFDDYLNQLKLGDYLQQKCGIKSSSKEENVSSSCKRLIAGDGSETTFWYSFEANQRLKEISKTVGENSGKAYLKEMEALRRGPLTSSTVEIDGFKLTLADEINLILPKARIIVIVRDPTKRMFSSYKWHRRFTEKMSTADFDTLTNEAIKSWNICRETFSERYCAYKNETNRFIALPVEVGLYSVYLREWLSVFPRDQILIVRNEDFSQNMKVMLKDIYKFLNLRNLDESTLDDIMNIPRQNTYNPGIIGEMLPQTEKTLRDFYRPFNEDLSSILDDTKFLWEDIL